VPAIKDFSQEAEMMQVLRHPNIVGYFGSGASDNRFNLVIEWMPG